MRYFLIALMIVGIWTSRTLAESLVSAKQTGKDLANSILGQVQNNSQKDINTKNQATDTSVATSINFKGTDVPEQNYTNENISDAKNQKAADTNVTEANIVSTSFLRAKEYPISLTNPFLDKANDAQNNPENYVDWLSGKYTDCNQEGGEDVLSKSSHTCDEFKEIKDNICSVGRSIEVDAKHKYSCHRKINKFEKVCTKSLVVAIDKQENCNAGAMEYLDVEGTNKSSGMYNVNWTYKYPSLSVSIVTSAYGNIQWAGETTSKKIYFNVKDKSLISAFTLNKIEIQGVATIFLNGHLLYGIAGYPYIQTSKFIHTDTRNGGRTHYYINGEGARAFLIGKKGTTSPSTDLLPYLKNGKNELTITGIPTNWDGHKLTNIYIEAKQICLYEKESWLEQCNGAES